MLVPKEIEKEFIYSLILDDQKKFEEIILRNKLDYERIISIISLNRIEYFILNKLDNVSNFNDLPINFLDKLKRNYFKKSIPTLKTIEKIFLFSKKLQESNLEHVFLKGISLHDQDKIYIRPMRDIDLLVNPKDIPRVVDLAKSLKFKSINGDTDLLEDFINNPSFYDLPLMADDNEVFLEIHFRITTNSDHCFLKDNIFESKRLIKIHGNNIYVPCQNSLFAHLVYHASIKGNFNVGLIALIDTLQIFNEVAKKEVLKISESLEMTKISGLFFELAEFFKNKNIILSKDAEKLKEVLVFPSLNSKITEILIQKSFSKMLSAFKDILFVSKTHLQREFETNKNLPKNFYLIKRWARQTNQYLPSFFFIFKNLIAVNRRNKIAKALLKK